jgi:hypothetical protein
MDKYFYAAEIRLLPLTLWEAMTIFNSLQTGAEAAIRLGS